MWPWLGLAFAFGMLAIIGDRRIRPDRLGDIRFRRCARCSSPLAWYGVTSSCDRELAGPRRVVAASIWIVGSIIVGLDQSHLFSGASDSIVSTLDKVNPMYYFQLTFDDQGHNKTMVQSMVVGIAGLSVLAVVAMPRRSPSGAAWRHDRGAPRISLRRHDRIVSPALGHKSGRTGRIIKGARTPIH